MSFKPDLNDLKARIEAADVYALAKRTPLQRAETLSQALGRNIWLKREDLQDVFSFKIRGAANRIAGLTDLEKEKGVVAASAGNHAQGVAKAAAHYGTTSIIFMPVTTPAIKVKAVEALGGQTRLVGDTYDAACGTALSHAGETGAVFVHPFDEPDIIAGQGTVAREMLEQMPREPDAIYVCTGGGGLVSGIATWVKAVSPDTGVIAVEPEGAACLEAARKAGEPVTLKNIDRFADGAAVRRIGDLTFAIAEQVVDRIITVSNDQICAAVRDIFEATRTVVEPAGALALAGLVKQVQSGDAPGGDLAAIVSGANVNFDRIGHIVERAELGAGEEMLFAATIPERPGAFLHFCRALGNRAVTEFNYRYADRSDAHVLVGVKLKTGAEREDVITSMGHEGISITDLSRNSLAKRHLRHMVGGRSNACIPEVIYRFEFPERPGALVDFLTGLDSHWNISLFHYRNHGHSTGHVLCGFQVPEGNVAALELQFDGINYPRTRETCNIAYHYFLSG
ncbi:MAG: threonine ammonia-lyase, biosynthetic [Hyphomonadaceae bacterium]|nr:threonine ammonia-lyase, biosynthetic [Hyphomonadaceae bacterium]MBC6411516.1 threonine ammonia-lyase, biosynthetic [Hyphomonadaceae bacterium]